MKRLDSLTADLFVELPIAISPRPGALEMGLALRDVLAQLIKACPLSRYQIAARMSELLGHEITKHQLDSWTAESREGWRFPLEYLPAFEVALETHELTAWIANARGARLSVGREVLETQLGKIEAMKDQLRKQEASLKKLLGENHEH